MVAKISIGSSLYGALSYNGMKMNRDEGRVLGANKIILPADGNIDMTAENGQDKKAGAAYLPKSSPRR